MSGVWGDAKGRIERGVSGCPCCSCSDAEFVYEREAIKPCYGAISTTVRWIRCQNCQLVRRENPQTREELQRFYESDGRNDKPPTGQVLHNKLVLADRLWQRATEHCCYNAGASALEIGSSWGEFSAVLQYQGLQVTGIEASETRAKWAQEHLGVQTLVGDALELLSCSDRNYSIVVMWEVLEHFHDPGQILRSVRGIMRSATDRLLLSTPCLDHPYHRAMGDTDPMWGVPEHLIYFDCKTLRSVLKAAGFDVERKWFSDTHLGCTRWVARPTI